MNTDADELYEHYLNSYPEGTNGIYRVRRDKDCSACRHFIKRMGNVVAINGGELETIWDVEAEIEFDGREFKLVEKLKSSPYDYSQKIWNVDTCKLTPVTVMCYSPNYWDDQAGIGNKHYMFMLKDCISEDTPNGFYNEYLNNDLSPHRKVFEALGTQCKAEHSEDQLSGLGFSSTVRNDLLVKVTGNTERMLRIKF